MGGGAGGLARGFVVLSVLRGEALPWGQFPRAGMFPRASAVGLGTNVATRGEWGEGFLKPKVPPP